MAVFRSVENARERTSTIAAMPASDARSARSSMVGSSAGGRLSTTNQPRSSSDLAAVDRPAPDRPVMITMSAASSAVLIVLSSQGGPGGMGGGQPSMTRGVTGGLSPGGDAIPPG